jgi:uncharacterized protein (UPF0147 family)
MRVKKWSIKMAEPTKAPAAPPQGGTKVAIEPLKPGITPETKLPEPLTPVEKRMLKAKIDGKEIEIDEDSAIRAFQKERASEKRFQDAAQMKKQAEGFLRMLKESDANPLVLEEIMNDPSIGVNFRKVAEQYLYEKIKFEQLSPDERKKAELKQELAQMEQAKQEQLRLQQEEELNQQTEQWREHYTQEINTALDKSDLPRTQYTIAQMARYILMGQQRGMELSADEIIPLVKRDYQNMIMELFSKLPADKLTNFVGEDLLKKLREADLAKVKGGIGAKTTEPTGASTVPMSPKPLSKDEWRNKIHQRANA